jgi:hypothetical protein
VAGGLPAGLVVIDADMARCIRRANVTPAKMRCQNIFGTMSSRATKVVVGIIRHESAEPELRNWKIEHGDVRNDEAILAEILLAPRKIALAGPRQIRLTCFEIMGSAGNCCGAARLFRFRQAS